MPTTTFCQLPQRPRALQGDTGRSRRLWSRDQPVVLNEPHEHASEHPMHRRLRNHLLKPGLIGFTRALRVPCGLPFGLQAYDQRSGGRNTRAQIVLQHLHEPAQIGEQVRGLNHVSAWYSACRIPGPFTGYRTRPSYSSVFPHPAHARPETYDLF